MRLTVVRVRSPAFILSRMSLGWVGFGASAGNAYKYSIIRYVLYQVFFLLKTVVSQKYKKNFRP